MCSCKTNEKIFFKTDIRPYLELRRQRRVFKFLKYYNYYQKSYSGLKMEKKTFCTIDNELKIGRYLENYKIPTKSSLKCCLLKVL